MIKFCLLTLAGFYTLASGLYADGKVSYTGLTPEENHAFEEKVDEALVKDKLKINELEQKISNSTKKLPPSVKLDLTKTKLNYEVKSQLAKNYLRTSVIQSDVVREELIKLLNQPSIKIEDLTAFQKLVNREKKRQRDQQ